VFRFPSLDNRILWEDESISVLRAAGYTDAQFVRTFDDGRVHKVREMRVYQGHGSRQGAAAVIHSAQAEDPQHPPLYYLMLHFWQYFFDGSILWQRVLSVLIGIVLIPAMYWLCKELFDNRRTAAIGATLIAISPFFVAYSRELRDYGLLALCAVVSGALLLRAQKVSSAPLWVLYAASVAAGLYANVLFALVLCGHVAYLTGTAKRHELRLGLAAVVAAVILYLPWIFTLCSRAHIVMTANDWSGSPWPIDMLLGKWLFNTGTAFFDLEYRWLWGMVVLFPILLVLAYAVYFTAMNATSRQKWFIAGMVIPSAVTFGLSDLLWHAHRSAVTRYGVFFYLGLLLCMTLLLGYQTATSRRKVWQAVTLSIVAAGLACCIVSSQSPVWWDNHEDDSIAPVAARINAASSPVIVAPAPWGLIYALSFRLEDNVEVMLRYASSKPLSLAPSGQFFIVTTGNQFEIYMKQQRGISTRPLYLASYEPVWEAFHRPLSRPDSRAAGASDVKLSMWRVLCGKRLCYTEHSRENPRNARASILH